MVSWRQTASLCPGNPLFFAGRPIPDVSSCDALPGRAHSTGASQRLRQLGKGLHLLPRTPGCMSLDLSRAWQMAGSDATQGPVPGRTGQPRPKLPAASCGPVAGRAAAGRLAASGTLSSLEVRQETQPSASSEAECRADQLTSGRASLGRPAESLP